jgi:hypothetical protein
MLSAAAMSFVPGGGPQAGAGGGGDSAMGGARSVSGSDKDVNIVLERSGNHNGNGLHHNNQHYESHKQGDMDYDVADENQWEMS